MSERGARASGGSPATILSLGIVRDALVFVAADSELGCALPLCGSDRAGLLGLRVLGEEAVSASQLLSGLASSRAGELAPAAAPLPPAFPGCTSLCSPTRGSCEL